MEAKTLLSARIPPIVMKCAIRRTSDLMERIPRLGNPMNDHATDNCASRGEIPKKLKLAWGNAFGEVVATFYVDHLAKKTPRSDLSLRFQKELDAGIMASKKNRLDWLQCWSKMHAQQFLAKRSLRTGVPW